MSPERWEYIKNRTPEQAEADRIAAEASTRELMKNDLFRKRMEEQFGDNWLNQGRINSADLTPGQNFLGGLLNAPGFVEDMANTKGVTGGPYATGENSGEPILNPDHPLNNPPHHTWPPRKRLPPIPGATQEIPVEPWVEMPERYNPFEGQWIIDKNGNRVPRTPENSVPGP